VPFATDDGGLDITELDRASDVWTETLQIATCDPAGRYRFRVTGRADKGAGRTDYALTSSPFTVEPADRPHRRTGDRRGNHGAGDRRVPGPGAAGASGASAPRRTGAVTLRVTSPAGCRGRSSRSLMPRGWSSVPRSLPVRRRACCRSRTAAATRAVDAGIQNETPGWEHLRRTPAGLLIIVAALAAVTAPASAAPA
jgi:hypothetical protein